MEFCYLRNSVQFRSISMLKNGFRKTELEELDPTLRTEKMKWTSLIKAYLKFYKEGLKKVWGEHKLAIKVAEKDKKGVELTWNEYQVINTEACQFVLWAFFSWFFFKSKESTRSAP
ncbi:hypothetical protein BB560_003038 [Smittium megazygosporum]|uniref:Uncharacterized protein n=1 Tax=Smittium megazygosporum TaxID=133381 RepID=A0A2T9ZD40_9FUNG|nr:hypothetical protein BB560_003038 [Smittium megazygosporum]